MISCIHIHILIKCFNRQSPWNKSLSTQLKTTAQTSRESICGDNDSLKVVQSSRRRKKRKRTRSRAAVKPDTRRLDRASNRIQQTLFDHDFTISNLSFQNINASSPKDVEEILDSDEVMIKNDPNDAAFEWDTDTPPPEDLAQRPNHAKSNASKHSKNKATATTSLKSRAEAIQDQRNSAIFKEIEKTKDFEQGRCKGSDDSFVVADDVVYFDTDCSALNCSSDPTSSTIDSDIEMQDTIPEDPEELRIDMRQRYNYNAKVLNDNRCSKL